MNSPTKNQTPKTSFGPLFKIFPSPPKKITDPPPPKTPKLPSLTFFTLLNIFLSPFFFQKLIFFFYLMIFLGFPNEYKVAFNLVPFERDFYVRGFLLNPFIKLLLQCLIKILLPPPSYTLSDEAFSLSKGSPANRNVSMK